MALPHYILYSNSRNLNDPGRPDTFSVGLPEDIYNYLVEETRFGISLSTNYPGYEGYLFGDYDESTNKFRMYEHLPLSASLEQIKQTVRDILNGKYHAVNPAEGGNPDSGAVSIIDLNLNEAASGGTGILQPGWLPEWLSNILNKLFGWIDIPWQIYFLLALVCVAKAVNKKSNRLIWGSLALILLVTAIHRYNLNKRKQVTA